MMSERGIKSSAIPSYTSHERIYFNFPFGANGAKQTVPTHLSHFLTAKTRDQLSAESHTPTDVEGHGTRRTKLYITSPPIFPIGILFPACAGQSDWVLIQGLAWTAEG